MKRTANSPSLHRDTPVGSMSAVPQKMATKQEKSFCVLEYARCSSVIAVQRAFRAEHGKEPPCKQSILRWYRQFKDTGCLCKRKSTGRPRVSDETVGRVRESFVRSPQKSTASASRELGIPQQTVWKILRRLLKFKPYGGIPTRHDTKESSDTESADHGPAVKRKKPRMNLTYILKKKKDKVAADVEDLKLQNVAMETEKEMEKPGTESSEHIVTPAKGKPHGQDVVYAELELQATRRPIVRREDDKTEYAEIIHTKPEEEGDGTQ